MSRIPLLCSIFVTGVVLLDGPAENNSARCTKIGYPVVRNPSMTAMLVRGLESTAGTEAFGGPGLTGEWMSASTRPGMPRLAQPTDTVVGQLAQVEQATGDQADAVQGGDRVVLIPWGYGADCRPIPWDQATTLWMPVGETVFVRGRLRDDSLWVDGQPTLDVPDAYWEAYPHEPFRKYRRDNGTDGALTAWELWDLYKALPSLAEFRSGDSIAGFRLEQWATTNSGLTTRYPASRILPTVRRKLSGRK